MFPDISQKKVKDSEDKSVHITKTKTKKSTVFRIIFRYESRGLNEHKKIPEALQKEMKYGMEHCYRIKKYPFF